MVDQPPADAAEHAREFSGRWAPELDRYCAVRMEALGVSSDIIGASDPEHDIPWAAFMPHDREGGNITTGITVNSGALNPDLLAEDQAGPLWRKARLRDRIDAIIAHEWEEDQCGSHSEALTRAPETELPISNGARRLLRAMSL